MISHSRTIAVIGCGATGPLNERCCGTHRITDTDMTRPTEWHTMPTGPRGIAMWRVER